jgi:hypothetical protein
MEMQALLTMQMKRLKSILCSEVLPVESREPRQLKDHFQQIHNGSPGKDIDLFK